MKINKQSYVLITGATSGIGYELARIFAIEGYNLVITARCKEDLEKTAAKLKHINPVKVIAIPVDLFDSQRAFDIYSEIKTQGIEIGILVNNAGHGLYGKFEDTDLLKELSIIQLNICSLVVLTKLFLKDMIARGEGKILNTSSLACKSPGPWQSVYHASKAFVQSFTEAIRAEVKDKGVMVTALLPGITSTKFFRKAGMESSKIVQNNRKMADPLAVAYDGYDGLMAGKGVIVSGLKNKIQIALDILTSDEKLALKTSKLQEPISQHS